MKVSRINKIISILLLLFGIFTNTKSQVINIEGKRFLKDTNGFVGRGDFVFNLTQNTQQILTFGINFHSQYRYNRHKILAISDLAVIKTPNQDYVNSGYQHLRYGYKLFPRLSAEAFLQAQYNRVLLLDYRYLAGIGPRVRIIKKDRHKLYVGCMYMFEQQSQAFETIKQQNHRMSSYVTFNIGLSKFDFSSTTFYQPVLNDFENYRIASDNNIDVGINNHFNLKIGVNLLFDTRQPPGVPELVYVIRNGISFRF